MYQIVCSVEFWHSDSGSLKRFLIPSHAGTT